MAAGAVISVLLFVHLPAAELFASTAPFPMELKKKKSPKPLSTTVVPETKPPASKPRGDATLSQLDYILQFHEIFMDQQEDPNPNRKFYTVEALSLEFDLGAATVKRYLEYMRSRLHLPVERVPGRGGQGYTQRVHAFPFHLISEGDMLLFVLAKRAFGAGTPFAERFEPLRQKVMRGLKKAAVNLERLESVVFFHFSGLDAPVPVSPEVWDLLANAAMFGREIKCQHLKAEPGAVHTHRVLWPLALQEIGNAWYVWTRDPKMPNAKPKKFLISRMSKIEVTGQVFERIPFNANEELGDSLGAHGGKAVDVHLHIEGKHALLVAERPPHRSYRLQFRPDGSLDLHLRVAHTPELEAWILMRAGAVRVLEPATLREAIHQLHSAGAERNE